MIRFEDLMSARWLYNRHPEHRDVLLAALETLRNGPASQTSLLGSLVANDVITMDQARYVHSEVEQFKRSRGLLIYQHLLTRDGIPATRVHSLTERLPPDGDLNTLGETILGVGLLPPHREHQLRFQARLALDRDMAAQVTQHLASHPAQPVSLSSPGGAEHAFLSSTVIRGGANNPLTDMAMPAEEFQQILEGTLSDADGELPGPRFRIPDWVDMSHPRTGKQMDKYRFLGLIGAGNMGEVYLVDTQEDPDRPIALKVLAKDAEDDAKGRFKREILANSFFSHPGALDVYDAGRTERGYHYLAMEFFDGRDLEKVLDESVRLPAHKAAQLAHQVFETLQAAHEAGLVHRDVKPANILVSFDGETAKLMDFGIAIIGDLSEFKDKVFRSMEGGITGTPQYMSPEQAAGDATAASSDLYSMGVALYQMLSGRLPFESETTGGYITCHMIEDPLPLQKADPTCKGLPEELLDLVMTLLEKDPSKRPQSAAAVLAVLDGVIPQLTERPSGRLFSFLGWRRS